MSRAEDLLLALSADTPVHVHPVVDSDTHYIIDPITRQLSNPNSGKTVIMQFDHYSEQFTFEIPRYVDGHDMLQCNTVRVHFLNIYSEFEQNAGLSYVDDLTINPDDPSTVTCTWLIPRDATQLVGPLNFLVQYACIDDNGNMTYEWHTDINSDNTVRAGMNNAEDVVTVYADVLEQWRASLFGAKDSILAEIVAAEQTGVAAVEEAIAAKGKEALDSIPEDYTATYNLAKEGARTKANAILLETEGENIAVDDSEDAYVRNLRVFGKTVQDDCEYSGRNMFNYTNIPTNTRLGTNITVEYVKGDSISDDYVSIRNVQPDAATATEDIVLGTFNLSESTTLTMSANNTEAYDSNDHAHLFVRREGYTVENINLMNLKFHSVGATYTVTLPAGSYEYGIIVCEGDIFAPSPVIIRPQLEIGSTATDFEPYIGGPAPNPFYPVPLDSIKPTVSIYGKNLAQPNLAIKTVNGYTVTPNADGSVTVTGSATEAIDTVIDLALTPAGSGYNNRVPLSRNHAYSIQCWKDGEISQTPAVKQVLEDGSTKWGWTSMETQDREITKIYKQFTPAVGGTSVCGTYYAQIELGEESTEYEPYKPVQTLAITRDIHGIPVVTGGNYTDSNGQQWVCDEIDFERGMYVHRIGSKTFNGTEGWNIGEQTPEEGYIGIFYIGVSEMPAGSAALCNRYVQGQSVGNTGKDGQFDTYYSQLRFNVGSLTTTDEWKAQLSAWSNSGTPLTVYHILTTPTETPLTTDEIAAFEVLRTNHTNTTVVNDKNAYMVMEYNGDIKRYLDKLPKATGAEVQAAVDAWLTAHFANAEGVSF